MEKYIPYEKLSKKKKREIDASRRNTWGSINPVTRKSPRPKAYNRRKAQNWKYDPELCFFIINCRIFIHKSTLTSNKMEDIMKLKQ